MGFSQMSKHLLGFHGCGAVSFIVFWVITQAASVLKLFTERMIDTNRAHQSSGFKPDFPNPAFPKGTLPRQHPGCCRVFVRRQTQKSVCSSNHYKLIAAN